jgi:hypothetical protein
MILLGGERREDQPFYANLLGRHLTNELSVRLKTARSCNIDSQQLFKPAAE